MGSRDSHFFWVLFCLDCPPLSSEEILEGAWKGDRRGSIIHGNIKREIIHGNIKKEEVFSYPKKKKSKLHTFSDRIRLKIEHLWERPQHFN